MAYNVFRVPNGITISPTGTAQVVSVIQGYSGQTSDLQQWQNSANGVLARIDSAGNFSGVAISGTNGVFSSNLAVNGGSITTSNTTANLFNTTATTINIGSAATQTNIGAGNGYIILQGTTTGNIITATGTINANGGTIATNQTTANLLNTTATTVNAFGVATALNIATGTMLSGVVNIATNNTSGTITIGSLSSTTTIAGNLIVNGTTTTVNSTTINVDDLNINVASDIATAGAADGGGITVGSGLGITMNYDNANTSWTSSQNFNIATTKTYKIAGTDVLNATGIGAGVVLSSLQRVGTIATGVWQGTSIDAAYTNAKVLSMAVAGTGLSISAAGTGNVTITSNATSTNTNSAIVTRDSAGNFSAGTITATLTGTATQVSNSLTIGSGLATTSATYNGSTAVSVGLTPITQGTNGATLAKITLDSYGRVTATGLVASGDIPNLAAAQITAGTLAVARGGTNLGSYAVGDILYADGAASLNKLAAVASGSFLVTNGVTTAPYYRGLLTADITGALGYTPASSASGVSGSGTTGKIAYWTGSGSITADADLSYDGTNNVLSIGTANINTPTSDITVSQSLVTLDSFSTSTYRSAKYLIQTKSAYGAGYQVSEALLIHDGTTAYVTEYGQIYTSGSSPLITLSATLSAGTGYLQAISSATGNLVRFYRTALNV